MQGKAWRWKLGAFGLAGTLLMSGCFGQAGSAGLEHSSLSARPPGGFGPVGPGGPTPPGASGGPPGPVNLAGYNQLAEYQAADATQKLAELQDENKSLLARFQGVQALLEERERVVLASRGEVQTAMQEVKQARQEIVRCRQEIASLRDHIRTTEKENQSSLQALVSALESVLDRGNPAAPPPAKEKEKDPSKAAGEKH